MQQPNEPRFTRPDERAGRGCLAVVAALLVVVALLIAAGWALVGMLSGTLAGGYERPRVDCATFRVDIALWEQRGRTGDSGPTARQREIQAAGAVDCVLERGMSAREISEQFGPPDPPRAASAAPDASQGPTAHVRRWSTFRNRFFYDVMTDGFDVWFDGPDLRRAVEIRLVHEGS